MDNSRQLIISQLPQEYLLDIRDSRRDRKSDRVIFNSPPSSSQAKGGLIKSGSLIS